MAHIVWWIGQCLLVLIAAFFVFFGISLFLAAYKLEDPFYFIMTVFGSNLMILISTVLFIGFILRMVNMYRLIRAGKKNGNDEKQETVG